jgi:hydrogenase maturation protease
VPRAGKEWQGDIRSRDTASRAAGAESDRRTLVLGIGNVLWADEGFGVRAVEALHDAWDLPPEVTLMDGGTQGLILLADVTAHRRVLVFDSIDFGDAPGTLRVLRDREVPAGPAPR